MTVAVVGLGRIGAPLAACLAAGGVEVIGVDVDAAKVATVNAGRAPVAEPGLAELMVEAPFTATTDLDGALAQSDAAFVVLPTRAEPDGRLAVPALDDVASSIAAAKRCALVGLVSTVMPGTTARFAAAAATPTCFAPEFVALGTAVRDYQAPAFALIGAADSAAADQLEGLLRRMWKNDPPVARGTYEEAEIAKLALNAFLATKISFSNILASVSEGVGNTRPESIARTLELDPRVGRGYLTGGAAFGGPCLPRDTAALAALAPATGAASLLDSVLATNDAVVGRVCTQVEDVVPVGGRVALCGLAFKAGTSVVEDSPALDVARRLGDAGYVVVGYDPLVDGRDLPFEVVGSLGECLRGADAAIVLTAAEEFRGVEAPLVIDWWPAT